MRYAEAMETYGCDKPDTRYGLRLATVTHAVKDSTFRPASPPPPLPSLSRYGMAQDRPISPRMYI